MKPTFRNTRDLSLLIASGAVIIAVFAMGTSTVASAQDAGYSLSTGDYGDAPPQPQTAPSYTQEQLDQLLAPIALYPDSLVGQVLMASTYPLEVVEAYRWQQQPGNANLQSSDLQAALAQQTWDPSVKSLVAFPQLLKTLNDNLQWMEQLGDAFLAQQANVVNEIQHLRQRAEAAGTLQSTPQQTVSTQGSDIVIDPANPDMVYVPSYNPQYTYGDWPYENYQPYYFPGSTYAGPVVAFGYGVVVADWFWGWDRWDWRRHRLDIDDRRFTELNRGQPPEVNGAWKYNPAHRHGVPYNSPALRAQYQATRTPDTVRNYRGYNPVSVPMAQRSYNEPRAATPRPDVSEHENRTTIAAPRTGMPLMRPAPAEIQRPTPAPVFESFSRGAETHTESERGFTSRASAPAPAPAPAFHGGSAPRPSGGGRANNGGSENYRH